MNKYDYNLAPETLKLRQEYGFKQKVRDTLIFVGIIALAVFAFWALAADGNADSMRFDDKSVTQIYSKVTDTERISIIRMRDGKTDCYIAYSKGNGSVPYGTSIECVK